MSLVFIDGFESGPGTALKPQWNPGTLVNPTGARTGSAYLYGTTSANVLTLAAMSKITMGFAWYNAVTSCWVTLKGDAGATSHLTIMCTSGGALVLRLGTNTGTILATATGVTWPDAVWKHVQIQATIADTGGRCIVKLDGVTVIDYTGDTKNAGTATTIDTILFAAGTTSTSYRWDDLWVCDGVDATATQGRPNNDFLGDLKVVALLPNAAGDTTQFTPNSAVANYTTVDDPYPPNSTDYNSSSVVGNRDLYNISDLPANTVAVYGIQVGIYAAKSDAGASSLKTLIKESSGLVSAGAVQTLSTSWASYFGSLRTVKPSDSTPFTVGDVNALQIGVEVA